MKTLIQEQFLPITLQEAWEFFSTPHNLNEITPEHMTFKILSSLPEKIYAGLFIAYQVKPLPFYSTFWLTEITHVKERFYFVDEQRKGPYEIWHHEHHFKEVEGGVLITDRLTYDIGKWIFGWVAGKLWVDRAVEKVFEFRRRKLDELFS
jgi:ligand-binding SRPBCC domain-containing protein